MPASIIINQSGKPAGSPSTSRDDLETGTLVTLTNATAESTYLWELLSKPVGSSASLSGATLPTATFTPDVTGSYRIRLTTNGSEVDIRIGAVKTANLDIRKPATDEETEFDSTDGWGAAHQAMIDTLDSRDAENFKRDGSIAATGDFDMGGNTLADVGGLRLQEVADPSAVADRGSVYVKDHFGDTELFYRDDSGNVVQLTKDGAVNAAGGGGSSGRVFVSSNDTNDGYLFEKIVPGLNSIVTELFDGGDEKLRVETAEVVQLPEQLSDPVFTGLDGYLYTKDVGGTTELFYMDSAGTVTQVTSDGYLDTFESLRGVGLFEQSSDPSTAVEKGFIYARTNDGYSELFYKGSHGFVAPLTRRGQVVGRHTAAVLTDEVALPGTTNITTLDPATTELASLTVDVADGERIQVNVALPIFFNTGGTGYCRLDIGGAVTGRLVASTAATGEYGNLSFPYVTDPLSAGSLTIRLLGSGAGGQNWEPVINGTMWVSRFRSDLSPTESDTALPRLVWADVSSVEVRAAPSDSINSDEVRVTLQDGKQRRFSGTLTFDFANGVGDLGLDTGSEASDTWYYLYLVPDVSNDTRLSLRASTSSPLTGPSGYANYRYIGAFRNGSAGGIRPFDQVGDWFLYRTLDGSANDEAPVIYSESGGTPSVGSWTQISLASAAPAGTAVAVRCMGQLDSDPGGAHDLVLAGSVGTPTWTPASTLSATVFLAGQENGQQANANVFQIPDGSLYRRWTQRTGAVDVTVRVQAWQDG